MTIDVERLATQIYVEMVSPCIMDRASQGVNLDKLFRSAAANSIAAAEAFVRCYEQQRSLPAVPVAQAPVDAPSHPATAVAS